MEKLKQVIENTLINNLEVEVLNYGQCNSVVELESIQICSDYISKEIQDIALEFAEYRMLWAFNAKINKDGSTPNEAQLFNEFINDRYKEQP